MHKAFLYCFPYPLFWKNFCSKLNSKSPLATAQGWPASANWQKLCNRIPDHEKSNEHRECYLGGMN